MKAKKKCKYWGVWNKVQRKWWTSNHKEKVDITDYSSKTQTHINFDWEDVLDKAKMINNIPIWSSKSFIMSNILLSPSHFEIREFTPADALLAKCGKI